MCLYDIVDTTFNSLVVSVAPIKTLQQFEPVTSQHVQFVHTKNILHDAIQGR